MLQQDDGTEIEVTGCPKVYCGNNAFDALRMSDMADKGFLPVAGGWLDQSESAIRIHEFISREKSEWKRELKVID